jgi:SAM-dependent methyltransferase
MREPDVAMTLDEDRRRGWETRHGAAPRLAAPPSAFLRGLADRLPRTPAGSRPPAALDVAGGMGADALWLAGRGFAVTLADFSRVALERAAAAAARAGLRLHTLDIDLETAPLPAGPWDVIHCANFLWRPLFPAFARTLAPGGLLLVRHPTRRNLERHAHPSARHLLEEGELPGLVSGLEILDHAEAWIDGRHEAQLVARRPAS